MALLDGDGGYRHDHRQRGGGEDGERHSVPRVELLAVEQQRRRAADDEEESKEKRQLQEVAPDRP